MDQNRTDSENGILQRSKTGSGLDVYLIHATETNPDGNSGRFCFDTVMVIPATSSTAEAHLTMNRFYGYEEEALMLFNRMYSNFDGILIPLTHPE